MSIGTTNKPVVAPTLGRPRGLEFTRGMVWVVFSTGIRMGVPLKRYPTLVKASPAQRKRWTMIGPAKGFYWRDLDLHLSVEGLFQGLPERIPAPAVRVGKSRFQTEPAILKKAV